MIVWLDWFQYVSQIACWSKVTKKKNWHDRFLNYLAGRYIYIWSLSLLFVPLPWSCPKRNNIYIHQLVHLLYLLQCWPHTHINSSLVFGDGNAAIPVSFFFESNQSHLKRCSYRLCVCLYSCLSLSIFAVWSRPSFSFSSFMII